MTALKVAAAVAVLTAAVAALAVALATRAWTRATAELDAALTAGAHAGDALSADSLPEPVRRYLARTAPDDRPAVARLSQEGVFQMGEGEEGWRPFTATEVMTATPPGFYWDADIRMAPMLGVRVRDAHVSGRGGMLGKILGLVTVVDAADEPALRRGTLSRYLAEAVWLPGRLTSGSGLRWRAIDANQAEATLRDGGTTVTLRFTFDENGDPVEVYGLRPREVDGAYVDTPWIGRFRDHREMDGHRIPAYGEVAWVVDGVEVPYWRGTIASAVFAP